MLGDTHYHSAELQQAAWQQGRAMVATQPGPYPHNDAGAPVRSIFHKLRSLAIEPYNGLFKNIFEWGGYLPVKGLKRTQLIVLGRSLFISWHCSINMKKDWQWARASKPYYGRPDL